MCSTRTGLSPTTAALSRAFHFIPHCHWPGPRSLATTCGVSVDVLSCRYLDVSVPCVRFLHPILFRCRYLITMLGNLFGSVRTAKGLRTATKQISQAFKVGFPIRISMDQSSFAAPHGFSQRITSFIACACQGIHQLPLRHLIVLIANAHHLVDRSSERPTDRVTFYNPAQSTMPSTCSIRSLYWSYAEQLTCARS